MPPFGIARKISYNHVMKKGILIVNSFLDTPSVRETYDLLLAGAKHAGISMELIGNDKFFADPGTGTIVSDKSDVLRDAGFILFWNKDVFLGRALERMGFRLYNSADAIEACDNKALTFERLEGVCPVPKTLKIPMTFNTIGYDDISFENSIGRKLGYPYVIKECLGSYGGQVYMADDGESAKRILKTIEGKDALAQEYIKSSHGRDLRAYVVGDRVVAAMERYNDTDFRSNIANGGKAKSYSINEAQENVAVTAVRKLGLDFAGVDILFGKDGDPILCEVNSNAQFRALLDVTSVDITDALFEYILNDNATSR